tara:strand:- start:662 stop:886 length:225 start_codon:yes stop_codon:yes gene_type:complete
MIYLSIKKGYIMTNSKTLDALSLKIKENLYEQYKLAKSPSEKINLLKFVRDNVSEKSYDINFDNCIKELELQIN